MTGEKKASATKYHRRALMETADRLLVEHGYDGMNMNMLAKEANYSKATVYVYFDSKDEIVRALAVQRLELLDREIALLVKSDMTSEEKLAELKRVLTEFYSEDGVYFDFITATVDAAKKDMTESEKQLADLVASIKDRLCSELGDELLDSWYAFYGRLKTGKMFKKG